MKPQKSEPDDAPLPGYAVPALEGPDGTRLTGVGVVEEGGRNKSRKSSC
jgi:hypothetical protein